MYSMDHKRFLELLPDRKADTHKGDYGKLLLLCGSLGYTGAPELAAKAALRVGTGLVFLGVPESIYVIEATKLTEPIVFPLKDTDGMLCIHSLEEIRSRMQGMDAILIGPGLGRSCDVAHIVCSVMQEFRGPVILDADGINVMKSHKDILRDRKDPTILTPHAGEFARFTGQPIIDRCEAASALAKDLGIIVVLKGHRTIITDGNQVFINPSGNPGMAVGGSGDVLAGVIAGLLVQGIDPLMSAVGGVWLHGAAGDACADQIGQYGMLPSDMLEVLPQFMK